MRTLALTLCLLATPALADDGPFKNLPKTYKMPTGFLGCNKISQWDYFQKLSKQSHADATKFVEVMLANRECAEIPEGATVYVMERMITDNTQIECLRVEGELGCRWTGAWSMLVAHAEGKLN